MVGFLIWQSSAEIAINHIGHFIEGGTLSGQSCCTPSLKSHIYLSSLNIIEWWSAWVRNKNCRAQFLGQEVFSLGSKHFILFLKLLFYIKRALIPEGTMWNCHHSFWFWYELEWKCNLGAIVVKRIKPWRDQTYHFGFWGGVFCCLFPTSFIQFHWTMVFICLWFDDDGCLPEQGQFVIAFNKSSLTKCGVAPVVE